MSDNSIGKLFRAVREKELLTRAKFSEKLGISIVHLINIEKGRANPSDKVKEKAIDLFGLESTHFDHAEDAEPELDRWSRQIGRNIMMLRKKANLTQSELAKEIGYSGAPALSAVERGQRPPSKAKLRTIAQFFQVHVAELLRVEATDDPAKSMENDKLLTDFMFLLHSKKKPAVFNLIVRLIQEGCAELRI